MPFFGLYTWLFGSIGSIVSLDGEVKIIRENKKLGRKMALNLKKKISFQPLKIQ
ncbi:hypothetical protein CMCT_1004 [Campylobacter mucosalis]|uniref:hypothetical protein n=1 Tax=Campylobacter mucosalis TaxID=202 RepID=UPI000B044D86|nr:hypothetical protein [Campylobacter mucosalis]QKF63140.1 hypothetical protein CMCT_1004 [Campylobacter mucosalis]